MSLAKKLNLRSGTKLRVVGKPKVRQLALDDVWSALRFRPR